MVVSMFFFAMMDAAMKLLSPFYPALQVAAMRGLASLPLVCGYILWIGQGASLTRVRWPLHLLRGVLGVAMLPLFVFAMRGMPLSGVYAIVFVGPLLITALSAPMLKERVPPAHWGAVALGLAGVLVALRPSADGWLSLGALAASLAACCYALSVVLGRLASRTDSAVSLVFWSNVFLAGGAGVVALPGWTPLLAEHYWTIPVLGLTGFFGQLAITQAFRHGQASAVAPFEYTALAWALGLDWFIWQALPTHATLIGAGIIVASGVYLIRHETVHAAAKPA
jgi:drug/metabolite transporter (DMT)-like permease